MGINDLFSVCKNSELLKSNLNTKKAIAEAVFETEIFISKRIKNHTPNEFIFENDECKHLAVLWKRAVDEMEKISPDESLGLRSKLKFWTDKELREKESCHSDFKKKTVLHLEQIKALYLDKK